jgi:hypothetical protein
MVDNEGCESSMAKNLLLHDSNAKKLWTYLISNLHDERFKRTYAEVFNATGVHWRTQGMALELIQLYCHENSLPHLTAIVVNKATDLPGEGCDADRENLDAVFRKVREYAWPTPPKTFLTPHVESHARSKKVGKLERVAKISESKNTWLLQVNSEKWDIRAFLAAGNQLESWSIVNNKNAIKAKDRFVLWSAGTNGGAIGWGQFTGLRSRVETSENTYWNADISEKAEFFGIQMEFLDLDNPVPRELLKQDPTFGKTLVFRSPQSANALHVSAEEWDSFSQIAAEHFDQQLLTVDEYEEVLIRTDKEISATTKVALVQSRVGQGRFRQAVLAREEFCRLTLTDDPDLLIASHIKPWRVSSNAERLDPGNGLALAPHVDRLFDKGWISFEDSGQLLVSDQLDSNILLQWGLNEIDNVGVFSLTQSAYLLYHREHVFRK